MIIIIIILNLIKRQRIIQSMQMLLDRVNFLLKPALFLFFAKQNEEIEIRRIMLVYSMLVHYLFNDNHTHLNALILQSKTKQK